MFSKDKYIFCFILLFMGILAFAGCDGVTPTSPIINSFTASPPGITAGESSTLNWLVTDADTLSINQSIGTVTGTSITVSPSITTTYTLTATNSAGSVTQSVTVNVETALGSIDIKSSPVGAKVYLDGVDTGQITPIVLTNVSAGTHTIKIESFHCKNRIDSNVTVNADETTYINLALEYAPTETLTLQPDVEEGKDATVFEYKPNTNFGNDIVLFFGYSTFSTLKYRSYLKFDLSINPLPSDAIITNACLGLYLYPISDSLNVGVYAVMSDWAENSINWNSQPTSSSEEEDSCTINSSSSDTWRYWYIDNLVKGWMNGSIPNYGVLIKPTEESSNNKIAHCRSSDHSTNMHRPKLEIEYYIP
jgi:hypothetical protein